MTWPEVHLKDVAEMCLGKMLDAKKNKGDLYPYLRNPNVQWMTVDLSDLKRMPFEQHELERYGLRAGDVLICEGGEAGRAAIWDGLIPDIKIQKAIHRVRPRPELLNRFLLHRIRYDYERGALADYYTGATIKHLTGQDLARYKFELPPLDEQKRIAAILDQADELRRKRQRALDRLNLLGQAIFIEVFGDPIENPFGYPVRSLDELIQPDRPLTYGILMPGEDVADGVPYVRVVDMRDGGIQVSSIRRTTPEISTQYKRSLLRPGDILISIRGHVGRTAIVPAILEGANITQDTARIACAGCAPDFLNELLRHYRIQDWMARRTKGAAVKGINLGDLRNLPVIVPPLEQQERFGEMVKAARGLAGQTQSQQLAFYALFASLQDRAFRGELTASSLMEAVA